MNILHLVLTIVAAVCYGGCTIPQILRIRKTKSARDVSLWYNIMLTIGITCVITLVFTTLTSWWVRVQILINYIGVCLMFTYVIVYKLKDRRKYANMRKNLKRIRKENK